MSKNNMNLVSAEQPVTNGYAAPEITTYTLATLWQRLGPATANTGTNSFPGGSTDSISDPAAGLFD